MSASGVVGRYGGTWVVGWRWDPVSHEPVELVKVRFAEHTRALEKPGMWVVASQVTLIPYHFHYR
jgi:hypothetical protein